MSTITVTNIQATGETASRAVSGVAAAWVNFNGSGTIAISDSVNVSSLDDDGTGQYGVNFTSAMGNATYSALVSHDNGNAGGTGRFANFHTYTTASADIDCWYVTSSTFGQDDPAEVVAVIHGDLA